MRLLGISGAGALLGACRGDAPKPPAAAPSNVPPPFAEAVSEAARGATPGLNVLVGAGDLVAVPSQRIPMGLVTPANKLVEGPAAKIWAGREGKLSGPFDMTYRGFAVPEDHTHGEGLAPAQGFYSVLVPFDRPGTWDLMVRTSGEPFYGFAAVTVAAEPASPGPGDPPVLLKTPTAADAAGVNTVCTRNPPCPMHEVSLDAVAGKGRTVVLSVATPAFCSSRMCGPVVDEIIAVREQTGGRAVFIHAEVFADGPTQKLAPVMKEWGFQSEPWTYIIGGDGRILARFEGPVVASEVQDALPQA